jgi:hypothetical protein
VGEGGEASRTAALLSAVAGRRRRSPGSSDSGRGEGHVEAFAMAVESPPSRRAETTRGLCFDP